ncbi:hypothetical protein PGB90_004935 [Kerria lacca]
MLLRCCPFRRLHSVSRLQKFVITLSNVSLEIAMIWLVIDVLKAAISLVLVCRRTLRFSDSYIKKKKNLAALNRDCVATKQSHNFARLTFQETSATFFKRSVGINSQVDCSSYGRIFKSFFMIFLKDVRKISRAADCLRADLPGLEKTKDAHFFNVFRGLD